MHNLIVERDLSKLMDERQRNFLSDPANIQRLNKQQASNAIDVLLKLPKLRTEPVASVGVSNTIPPANEVPAGRYFIVDPKDNVEKFIKVDKPEPPSKWAGYTFVSVQASDDFYPIKARNHREAILEAIAKDPVTAMNTYGQKLGVCGRCGRTLTQRDSRLRGLGPICADIIRTEFPLELSRETLTGLLNNEGGE